MKLSVSLILSLLFSSLQAQDLLLNGGFEDENTCTEYRVNCAPEAWISSSSGFSNYFNDPGRAHSGSHCMAIEAGHTTRPYDRSFIRSQFVCQLKKGQQYRFSLFIKSPHSIMDSIGVYFGPIDPLLERKPIYRLAPSLFLADGTNRFSKDSSWQKASLDYTANGDELYVTIANFSLNDINGKTGISRENRFFVFVDDISMTPLDPNERLCDNREQIKEEIYEQDARHQYLKRLINYNNTLLKTKPGPTLIIRSDTLLLPDVLFASGKADLQPGSMTLLDSFCREMAGKKIDSLVIEGHADSTGTASFNEELSNGRAEAVAARLRQCTGLFRIPLITRGWGSRRPLVPNRSPENRQKNRRVEMLLYFRE